MIEAELREATAPPEIAAHYAALREATGLPLVNLIWRRMATRPGLLAWALESVRPALRSGAVAAAAERLPAALPMPRLPALPSAGEPGAADVVAAYNRGNILNLLVLTALRRRLDSPGEVTAAWSPVPPPPMLPPVPPIPTLATLPPAVAGTVRRLAASHPDAVDGVIPSLYLHLALWPALLAAVEPVLAPALADGSLRAAREAAIDAAHREARALLPLVGHASPVPEAELPALRATLDAFTGRVIPQMIPVGLALAGLLRG
ncbi:hypothetical protein M0638_07630 [Roseomonas sp. NAR14]|uniref:Uncharacterized protein n=1 Tax=Roseomonas acroporae TaxID=2937791 RepID=A0A9X1YCY9_9PROT|nr:hypothetical protein [Roseomonas acroporae]MCK8784246.1 hypothetical protein [Roseomonas acroporae]